MLTITLNGRLIDSLEEAARLLVDLLRPKRGVTIIRLVPAPSFTPSSSATGLERAAALVGKYLGIEPRAVDLSELTLERNHVAWWYGSEWMLTWTTREFYLRPLRPRTSEEMELVDSTLNALLGKNG